MNPWITELSPLSFLERSAMVFPDKVAVVHGDTSWTYSELAQRVEHRARMFRGAGLRPGQRVAYLMPNVPEMLVAHFAVPLVGGILVSINTRLSTDEVRYILDHAEASILIVDSAFAATVAPIAESVPSVHTIVVVDDPIGPGASAVISGAVAFADLVAGADEDTCQLTWAVVDERLPIAINYTSGTTGRPKGVVYTHRGAYLNALGEIIHSRHDARSVYLWTLPMFHCSGWCTTWALVAAGGTQVCLREVRGPLIWGLMDRHGVTHLNGAPTVISTILNAPETHQLDRPVVVTVAGAPPSPTLLAQAAAIGFAIVHVYGLTETYGPYTVCERQDGWADLSPAEQAHLQSRQGVAMLQSERVRVVETELRGGVLVDVPADGQTMGEIVMRGNNVMQGYFRDPEATANAFAGGWFHSGDLGVMHGDGYVELRDRAKDVIISGGENISTVEVEHAIASHPDVLEAAVVGVPDERWGERPKAFVVLRPGRAPSQSDLIEHVQSRIARYKAPREVEFLAQLPKTSTGKVRKFELREKEWSGQDTRIRG